MEDAPTRHKGGEHPDLRPPTRTIGVIGWMRENLFSSPLNVALTALGLYLIYITVPPLIEWAFTSAVVSGQTRAVCDMGRRAGRMNAAMAQVDPDRLGAPEMAKPVQEVQDYLSQFISTVTAKDAAVPGRLAVIIEPIDLKAVEEDLAEAFRENDAAAVRGNFAILAPIGEWGEANNGACWTFVKVWRNFFLYARYPNDQQWRVNLAFLILVVVAIPVFVQRVPGKRWIGAFLLVGYPIIAYFLFYGGAFGLPVVETRLWGGLFLTLVISGVGIVASLPIGVVLALGRRSHMPVVRAVCVAFIELWRGVPLISVLFMASVMFPLFLPEGMNFDKLVRALLGVALFSSAYMAEVVRGGLQAIPKGQYEAAEAMGLSFWKSMSLVILPQALKLVIPGIVNTFIGLFKDTTLVLIIGLFDLLGAAQAAATNQDWLGFATEAYVTSAVGFWIFCFLMSRYSIHLERRLETGHRR